MISQECEECDGVLILIGMLGNRLHFRCRHCGLDQSQIAPELMCATCGWTGNTQDMIGQGDCPECGEVPETFTVEYA